MANAQNLFRMASLHDLEECVASGEKLEQLLRRDYRRIAEDGLSDTMDIEEEVWVAGETYRDCVLSNGQTLDQVDATPWSPWVSPPNSLPAFRPTQVNQSSVKGFVADQLRNAHKDEKTEHYLRGFSEEVTTFWRTFSEDRSRLTKKQLDLPYTMPSTTTYCFPLPLRKDGNDTGVDVVCSDSLFYKLFAFYYSWFLVATTNKPSVVDDALKAATDYSGQFPGSLEMIPAVQYQRAATWPEDKYGPLLVEVQDFNDCDHALSLALTEIVGPEKIAGKYKSRKSPGFFKYYPDLNLYDEEAEGWYYPCSRVATGYNPANSWMIKDYGNIKRAWGTYVCSNFGWILQTVADGSAFTAENRIERIRRDLERVQSHGVRRNNPDGVIHTVQPGDFLTILAFYSYTTKMRELTVWLDPFTPVSVFVSEKKYQAFINTGKGVFKEEFTRKDGSKAVHVAADKIGPALRHRGFLAGHPGLQHCYGEYVRWVSYFHDHCAFGYPTENPLSVRRFMETRAAGPALYWIGDASHFETQSTTCTYQWKKVATKCEHHLRLLYDMGITVTPDSYGGHLELGVTASGQEKTSYDGFKEGTSTAIGVVCQLLKETDRIPYIRSYKARMMAAMCEYAALLLGVPYEEVVERLFNGPAHLWFSRFGVEASVTKDVLLSGKDLIYKPMVYPVRRIDGSYKDAVITPSGNSDDMQNRFQAIDPGDDIVSSLDTSVVEKWLDGENMNSEWKTSINQFGCIGFADGTVQKDDGRQLARALQCYEFRTNSTMAALSLSIKLDENQSFSDAFCFAFACMKDIHGVPIGSVVSYHRSQKLVQDLLIEGGREAVEYFLAYTDEYSASGKALASFIESHSGTHSMKYHENYKKHDRSSDVRSASEVKEIFSIVTQYFDQELTGGDKRQQFELYLLRR